MNIYVYSDESGVFDKRHNKFFVFGGLLFLSGEDKDIAARKYTKAERVVRGKGNYKREVEIKACTITAEEKGKLYRSLNGVYKFGVVINQSKVLNNIMADKKSKQRFLDYAFKIGVKRLLETLISDNIIDPSVVENMFFHVDEHSTSTNGLYELRESLEEEFKRGVFSHNFKRFFPPIFPNMKQVSLRFCNSETVRLIRAADIVANRIYHKVIEGKTFEPFDSNNCKLFVSYLP